MTKTRYFIRDCEGRIIGNPKGYDTYKGASRQANHGKANRQAWNAYAVRFDPKKCTVWAIRAEVV